MRQLLSVDEKQTILELLREKKTASAVAEALGVSDRTLRRRMLKYGLPMPPVGRPAIPLVVDELTSHVAAFDAATRAELLYLGAPLYGEAREPKSFADALVRGALTAHRDPLVALAMPVCLQLHAFEAALALPKAGREFGFFLDLTGELSGRAWFSEKAQLYMQPFTRVEPFFAEPTAFSRMLAERNTPALARKWGWRMNMGLDAFAAVFKKHA